MAKISRVRIYRTYRFIDKDPAIDAARTVIENELLSTKTVHQISGLATATLDNWFTGSTRQPQNSSLTAFAASLGYVRRDTMRKDGTVEPSFVKVRDLDYRQEIEKQADFLLAQNSGTKKRKTNGGKR